MGLFDMVKRLHPDSQLFGFLAGPHGVFTANYMEITAEYMNLYRNMGGFDMIRSGRHKIETPEQFESSLKCVTDLDLDGLAVIGGDDSNTNACLLAEYFAKHNSKCVVVGCPKTIDGDLKNEHIEVSFGFDTATKVFSEAIGNLCTDAVSSRKYYYFVRLMGRSASHIALECALQTRVNLCLIGEEVEHKQQTLQDLTMQVCDTICKRAERGKDYGIILVPEGLIEFIPEVKILISEINEILSAEFTGDIQTYVLSKLSESSRALFNRLPSSVSSQLLLDRDPHGNVQVSKIDTERLLILMAIEELDHRKKAGIYKSTFKPQSHFFGYEGRCALPSNFDSSYCYALGMNAAVLMLNKCSGYMSCVKNLGDPNPSNWIAAGCPLPSMMGIERRKGKDKPVITKALVRLDGGMFKCYEALRTRWAFLDCYQSPGPI
jgi:diphosphate--fructose-6-phosphate 1-phosphotransferase